MHGKYNGSTFLIVKFNNQNVSVIKLNGSIAWTSAFALSFNADAGSTIKVYRTASDNPNASIGQLLSGSAIYYNDSLRLEFYCKDGYRSLQYVINGDAYSMSGTSISIDCTVDGDLTITASTVRRTWNCVIVIPTASDLNPIRLGYNTNNAYIEWPDGSTTSISLTTSRQTITKNGLDWSDIVDVQHKARLNYASELTKDGTTATGYMMQYHTHTYVSRPQLYDIPAGVDVPTVTATFSIVKMTSSNKTLCKFSTEFDAGNITAASTAVAKIPSYDRQIPIANQISIRTSSDPQSPYTYGVVPYANLTSSTWTPNTGLTLYVGNITFTGSQTNYRMAVGAYYSGYLDLTETVS